MIATDGAPIFDGTTGAIFHARWRRAAIFAAMRNGAFVGALTALLACLFVHLTSG